MARGSSVTEQEAQLLAALRRATFDPGQFCEREFTDHGDTGWPTGKEYEPLHAWQARAALVAIKELVA